MNKALHLIEEEGFENYLACVLIVWRKISEIELKNYQYLFPLSALVMRLRHPF